MIEKLDLDLTKSVATNDCIINKINELVDAVNYHQKWLSEIQRDKDTQNTSIENVQDEFAEQRKWIGCVCRFWYDNPNDTLLDYLDKIQTGKNGVVQYYSKESGDWFPHCEPVLPTDNAIYKGGNNE